MRTPSLAAFCLLACSPSSSDLGGRTHATETTAGASSPTLTTVTSTPTSSSSTTSPSTSTTTDPVTERRWDCSGIDAADAAPLGGYVALTFDDGPDVTHTAEILGTLRAYSVPATFFVVGEMLAEPDTWPLVEDLVADPLFDLANHTWSHADLTLLSTSAQDEEIDEASGLIETFDVAPAFFRFPYGSASCDLVDRVRARGMRVAGWHIDTADWCYAVGDGSCHTSDYWRIPPEHEHDMLGFTLEQIRRFDGGVVLLHDIHAWTADQLETLILEVLAAGYTFTSLDDPDAFPNLVAGTPADLPYLGERCDTVDDRCWQVEYLSWCEPTDPDDATSTSGFCTLPCEGTCLDRDGAATTFCATVPPGAGQCVARSALLNGWCADVPGTVEAAADRFVGTSGASPATVDACVPETWSL